MTNIQRHLKQQARDYERVGKAIAYIEQSSCEQPSLDDVACHMGLSPYHTQRLFSRWAGVSPKQFLGYVTHAHARALLQDKTSVLDAAYEVGLSGSGRLHDLCLSIEAMTPGEIKSRGEGVQITYGFHDSPFGRCLILATDRGIAGLAFADLGREEHVFTDMKMRWPAARFRKNEKAIHPYAECIFTRRRGDLRLVLAGTAFQLKVWEALLDIPPGRAVSYKKIAQHIGAPRAVRAVASAIGCNPVSYLIPCHRVLRETGALGGYRWGVERKRALLAWESAQIVQTCPASPTSVAIAPSKAIEETRAAARS